MSSARITYLLAALVIACGPDDNGSGDTGGAAGDTHSAGAGSSAGGSAGNGTAGSGGGNGGDASTAGRSGAPGGGSGGQISAGGSGALAIASTPIGTCAVGNTGQVACWGIYPDMPEFGWMPPAGSFTGLVAGSFLCAQRATGELTCFQEPRSDEPLEIAPTTPVRSFDIGVSNMCWVNDADELTCQRLDPPSGVKFKRVSNGRSYGCGIRADDASIVCWGDPGTDGDCGLVPDTGHLTPPSGEFVEIDTFTYTSCALRKDGTVACWGAGDATDDAAHLFCDQRVNFGQAVPPPGEFKQISVGTVHACGVKTDGTVACWGAGTKTGCGEDLECGQSTPPPGTFSQVSVGRTHTCAIRADRTVACWGSNTGGRSTPPADFP